MTEESDVSKKLGMKLSEMGMKEFADGVIEEIKNDATLKETFNKIDQSKFLAMLNLELCKRDDISLEECLMLSDFFFTLFAYINIRGD
ncbi:MAG: hypothetical protein ACP5G8_09050 [Athalassotoga sp.]